MVRSVDLSIPRSKDFGHFVNRFFRSSWLC